MFCIYINCSFFLQQWYPLSLRVFLAWQNIAKAFFYQKKNSAIIHFRPVVFQAFWCWWARPWIQFIPDFFFFFSFFTALELQIIVCCSIKSSLLDLKYDTLWLQWKSTIILSLSRNLWTNYTLSLCCWALTATFSQFFSNFFSCI